MARLAKLPSHPAGLSPCRLRACPAAVPIPTIFYYPKPHLRRRALGLAKQASLARTSTWAATLWDRKRRFSLPYKPPWEAQRRFSLPCKPPWEGKCLLGLPWKPPCLPGAQRRLLPRGGNPLSLPCKPPWEGLQCPAQGRFSPATDRCSQGSAVNLALQPSMASGSAQ